MLNKISVIVPVYNVQDYVEECLKSIVKQTYKNLEIIIVNDGSTDNSMDIVRKFEKADSRIKVLEQANQGLSAARNAGIEAATGDYISFVDSDDYIHPRMLELLLKEALATNSEVTACDYTSGCFSNDFKYSFNVYIDEEAIQKLFDKNGYRFYAWNKLYASKLFDKIRFPYGENFEDIPTTYAIFNNMKGFCYIKLELYFYRQRSNSITSKKFSNSNYCLVKHINDVMSNIKEEHPKIYHRMIGGYLTYYLSFINSALASTINIDNYSNEFIEIARNNLWYWLFDMHIMQRQKIQIGLLLISKRMYRKIYLKHKQ